MSSLTAYMIHQLMHFCGSPPCFTALPWNRCRTRSLEVRLREMRLQPRLSADRPGRLGASPPLSSRSCLITYLLNPERGSYTRNYLGLTGCSELIQNYLEVGEYTFDFVVVFLGVSLGCETDFGSENVAHRSQLHNEMNVPRQRSSSFKRLR